MGDQTPLPLKPPPDTPAPRTPAPAWVALASAWLGLLCVLTSMAVPLVPGSTDPTAELTHAKVYSWADRVILVPAYLAVSAIFLGFIVFRQMATEPRPLPDALLSQRTQAKVGIVLGLVGAAIMYIFVALRGPTSV